MAEQNLSHARIACLTSTALQRAQARAPVRRVADRVDNVRHHVVRSTLACASNELVSAVAMDQ
jgi:hypothetical protein